MLTNAEGLNDIEPMPIEEYLRSNFRPDRDYIDKAARERTSGFWPHSEVMAIVGGMLSEATRANDMITLMSVRMWIDEQTIMVPDLAVIPRSQRNENILTTPPILCVEVRDARDTFVGLQQRADRYLQMGVKNVWLIDAESLEGYYASQGGLEQPTDRGLCIYGTALSISLTEVEAELGGS